MRVNGVELHYTDRGDGQPVVFVHGALDDYRLWEPQVAAFARHHRVITYSRRYNWPNRNRPSEKDYSALADAADLSALMGALGLAPAHLVGHSYGGFVALWLAVQAPGRVLTLTLAEPAAFSLLAEDPEGRAEYRSVMSQMWHPASRLFEAGEDERALGPIVNWFAGRDVFDRIPPEERRALLDNLPEWKALATSARPFPEFDAAAIRQLAMPVLLITGSATQDIFKRVDGLLERKLSDVRHVHIAGATHDMWTEQPQKCGEVVQEFID